MESNKTSSELKDLVDLAGLESEIEDGGGLETKFAKTMKSFSSLGAAGERVGSDLIEYCDFTRLILKLHLAKLENAKLEQHLKLLQKKKNFLLTANDILRIGTKEDSPLVAENKRQTRSSVNIKSEPGTSKANEVEPITFVTPVKPLHILLSKPGTAAVPVKFSSKIPYFQISVKKNLTPSKPIQRQFPDSAMSEPVCKKIKEEPVDCSPVFNKVLTRFSSRKLSMLNSPTYIEKKNHKGSVQCQICEKFLPNEQALNLHIEKAHMRILRPASMCR